jgi:methyl-accepting chemotaxis protein
MKNLFLAYKHCIIITFASLTSILLLYALWGSYFIFAPIFLFFFFAYECYRCFKFEHFFKVFSNVCEDLKKGDFESRIVLPKEGKIITPYIDKFNDVIDVCDAFIRESSLTMKAVSEERFHRKIRSEGFLGAYRVALKRINHSVFIIDEKNRQEKMLKATIDHINYSIAAGHLDIEISTDGFSKEYLVLVEGLKDLVQAVSLPIKESIHVLQFMAKGDFSHVMKGDFQGYFKELQTSFDQTACNLSDMIKSLNHISYSMGEVSKNIVRSAAEVSEKAESQASALQETAASLEELTSTVRQNSENATESEKLAKNVQNLTLSTHHVMDETVTSIKSIKESADKIKVIIDFLDEISFQTNMLALNAAIEAARAGSAGKGFAVVADEVRQLATRSSEASHEMKRLLQASDAEVENGFMLIMRTNESIGEISESIKRVTSMVSEITTATIEQTSGIEQINIAICQLDQVTQINSAAASENHASTESINKNVSKLISIVDTFKVRQA